MSSATPDPIPVYLLKTKSSPGDAYEDLFSGPQQQQNGSSVSFNPIFVPVLQHKFSEDGLAQVANLLKEKRINSTPDSTYGGLIFTSQRAVEAFAKVVQDDAADNDDLWPHLQNIPIYSVGPATTRALNAIPQTPPLQIYGSHTGNGEALANFILQHYGKWYADRSSKPALLFMVGETRRDIIPKTLTSTTLADSSRIPVTETVVYGTGVMESFASDFTTHLSCAGKDEDRTRWAVVFSPTGCDDMLRVMGVLDEEGRFDERKMEWRATLVATIGPTTRDHLRRTFGFEPDVCAETPTPEGVMGGIVGFMNRRVGLEKEE